MTLPRDLVGHHRSVIDQAVRPHELHLPFHPPVQHFTFEIDTVGHQTLRLAIECIVCRGHLNVQIRVKIRLEFYSAWATSSYKMLSRFQVSPVRYRIPVEFVKISRFSRFQVRYRISVEFGDDEPGERGLDLESN